MRRVPSPVRLTQHLFDDELVSADVGEVIRRNNGVGAARRRGKRLIAFGWYGGKFSHLEWLLPHLPACHHYCEPFGGSAAVLLNRGPSPIETYNDLDGEVVNFFRVLRTSKDHLVEAIALTPFSNRPFYTAGCSTLPRIAESSPTQPSRLEHGAAGGAVRTEQEQRAWKN